MRSRCLVVTAKVLLSAVWVMAQSTGRQSAYPNSATPSTQQPAAMAPLSETQTASANKHDSLLEGCIGGSNERLTLTDAAGKVYQLRGDTAKLSDHIGQHASIMGTEEHNRSTQGLDGEQTTFTVKKVAIIASVCTISR